MKLVLDASVLFAAIISKGKELRGKVLDVFFHDDVEMFAPAHLFAELSEHEERIRKVSDFSKDEFDAFVAVEMHLARARTISHDPDDAPYLAAALSLGCGIWTNDPHFQQLEVKAYSTSELSKLLFS